MQKVRQYQTKEILDKVSSLPSFKGFPKDFWLVGIRSNEDTWNTFDDKAYLFKGETFIELYKITTNAGNDLLNPTNPRGEAVLKADGIYYDSWVRGRHRGKVEAYVQSVALPIHRDNDKDRKIEELGKAKLELVGINIHPSTYNPDSTEERLLINGWSQGCQVFAKRDGENSYDSFMAKTKGQRNLTYCLLNEFDPKETKIKTTIVKPTNNNLISLDLTDNDINEIVESIKPSIEKIKNPEPILTTEEKIDQVEVISTREKPSLNTKVTSHSLVGTGLGGVINSAYQSLTNPDNLTTIIVTAVVGIILITIGVLIYRKSAAEHSAINSKKLDYLSDPNRNNPDLR